MCTEKLWQHFNLFLAQSKVLLQNNKWCLKIMEIIHISIYLYFKHHFIYEDIERSFHLISYHFLQEKQQEALTLVKEAEGIFGMRETSPATNIFLTMVSSFKSNMDDFILRVEKRHIELNTLVQVHRFCEQVSASSFLCIFSSIYLIKDTELATLYWFPLNIEEINCTLLSVSQGVYPGQGMQSLFGEGRTGVLLGPNPEHTPDV